MRLLMLLFYLVGTVFIAVMAAGFYGAFFGPFAGTLIGVGLMAYFVPLFIADYRSEP